MVISDSTSDQLVTNSLAPGNAKPQQKSDIRSNETVKKLRIQIGVVSRLLKDQAFYLADADKVLAKIDDMKVCHEVTNYICFIGVGCLST